MTYGDRNAAVLATLDPVARDIFTRLEQRLDTEEHEDVLFTDGRRTSVEQDAEFAKVPSVTHVNDSNSFHTHGVAIDLVPIDIFGGTDYDAFERYQQIARIAKEMGIEWGFAMWGFDEPHFQYRQGLTIEDFKAGKRLQPLTPGLSREELETRLKIAEEALSKNRVTGLRKFALTRFIVRVKKALGRA